MGISSPCPHTPSPIFPHCPHCRPDASCWRYAALCGFTKQEKKEKSKDALLFFLLISFGDFNKAHFNKAYLCDKHTYFNMPLTININRKQAKTSRYPEAAESLAKAPSLRRPPCAYEISSSGGPARAVGALFRIQGSLHITVLCNN